MQIMIETLHHDNTQL